MKDEFSKDYLSTKEAREMLRITTQTLRNWDKAGKIRSVRTPSGIRLYNREDVYDITGVPEVTVEKRKVCYARVSSSKQKDDLERQVDFLRSRYPDHDMVTDVGSGVNWKRKGVRKVLEQAMRGEISELVVAHKDRLARFSFELVEFILKTHEVKLVVLDSEDGKSTDQELTDDILSIIHIYSCRKMGRRRYERNESKDLSDEESEGNSD